MYIVPLSGEPHQGPLEWNETFELDDYCSGEDSAARNKELQIKCLQQGCQPVISFPHSVYIGFRFFVLQETCHRCLVLILSLPLFYPYLSLSLSYPYPFVLVLILILS